MTDIIISLDIGTTKIAALAWDCVKKQTIEIVSEANSSTLPELKPGYHEQDAECIWGICRDLIRRLVNSDCFCVNDIRSIAISGQMHGVLLIDKELRPLSNLITWCDQRSAGLTASIDRSTWPVERTGCFLHSGYGGATLAILASEGKIPNGAMALTIADYIAARLCGVIATGASHAASWGIMDVRNQCWDAEIISRLEIPAEILPEIKPGMTKLGRLNVDWGLPEDTTVRLPLGDNQASFFGTCGLANDAILFNLGTGGQISFPVNEFQFNAELETRPLPFGGYMLVGASLCGGRSYALLKDFFRETIKEFTGTELADGDLYRVMDRMAEQAKSELAVDTRFVGTRLEPDQSGSIDNIRVNNFSLGTMCRGFTRGMIRELSNMMDRNAIGKFTKIMVSGNGIRKNPLAQQFITEELGLQCVASESREEAAVGAAIAAAKAAGLI